MPAHRIYPPLRRRYRLSCMVIDFARAIGVRGKLLDRLVHRLAVWTSRKLRPLTIREARGHR